MISRDISPRLKELSRQYSVVTVTGPRQSGKTTLVKNHFKSYAYYSLEDLDTREFAKDDPRGFLSQAKNMIIDEVQKVPDLVSYIQGIVDKENRPGQFILTGSHQFEFANIVSQSLAGRTAILKLLPFSMHELRNEREINIDQLLYRGFYPRIIDQGLNPTDALSFYTSTYLEKDLRELKEIRNLSIFEKFLKLCASNVGQVLNKNRFANDLGITNNTVDSWLSILEASYIIYLLPPHFKNFRKRVVKSPKLYFYDVGLASYLLGIKNEEQLKSHPLKGSLFENLVILEKLKNILNRVESPELYYFRDNVGNEVDLLEDKGISVSTYEIKLAQTISQNSFKGLKYYRNLNPENNEATLIYTGDESGMRFGFNFLSIRDFI